MTVIIYSLSQWCSTQTDFNFQSCKYMSRATVTSACVCNKQRLPISCFKARSHAFILQMFDACCTFRGILYCVIRKHRIAKKIFFLSSLYCTSGLKKYFMEGYELWWKKSFDSWDMKRLRKTADSLHRVGKSKMSILLKLEKSETNLSV